ncbi:MAG: hypothetical protein H0T85_02075, partial [Geodermatophilaceae bacterium]|nr:hypothetical protein [Geodermatophilaceae bacterium]
MDPGTQHGVPARADLMSARRGRRHNGLEASFYVPLRDVDPRVGEHLLDLLREAGIAAYLEPTSDIDSYTRAVSLPSPPSDRLWVDRSARPDASSLVADHADDPPTAPAVVTAVPVTAGRGSGSGSGGVDDGREGATELDEKALWEQIVAGWDRDGDTPVPRWPAQEDADPGEDADDEPAEAEPVGPPAPPVHDPDDHYLPP